MESLFVSYSFNRRTEGYRRTSKTFTAKEEITQSKWVK